MNEKTVTEKFKKINWDDVTIKSKQLILEMLNEDDEYLDKQKRILKFFDLMKEYKNKEIRVLDFTSITENLSIEELQIKYLTNDFDVVVKGNEIFEKEGKVRLFKILE